MEKIEKTVITFLIVLTNKKGAEDEDEWDRSNRDKLIDDYDSVLRESALMTTVAGILFGFILNISVRPPDEFSIVNEFTLIVSLLSIVIATLLFSMPVIYHHIQYPYSRFDKFQLRSHRFIVFGIVPFFLTLYLSLTLAISILLDHSTFDGMFFQDNIGFVMALFPFVIIYILYKKRK